MNINNGLNALANVKIYMKISGEHDRRDITDNVLNYYKPILERREHDP